LPPCNPPIISQSITYLSTHNVSQSNQAMRIPILHCLAISHATSFTGLMCKHTIYLLTGLHDSSQPSVPARSDSRSAVSDTLHRSDFRRTDTQYVTWEYITNNLITKVILSINGYPKGNQAVRILSLRCFVVSATSSIHLMRNVRRADVTQSMSQQAGTSCA